MRKIELLNPARAILRIADWPEPDRSTWERAKSRAVATGPFRKHGGGFRHATSSVLKSERGVGRWLGFLQRTDRLETCACPMQRLTPANLDAYFEHFVECGNTNRSIVGRFEELQLAFALMFPKNDFGWITAPQGTPLKHLLPHHPQPTFVPDSAEALAWALQLFQTGLSLASPYHRCVLVRDALIIAVLATRAPRLRALSSLRLGTHLYQDGQEWVLDQQPSITKGRNEIILPLPPEVGVMVDRYLSVERLEMLHGSLTEMVWVTHGRALGRSSLVGRVRLQARDRFGVEFGPHAFRYGLTTTLAMRNPSAPLDAPLILGHGPAVSLATYNRAKAISASQRQHTLVQGLRRDTEELARVAFGDFNARTRL